MNRPTETERIVAAAHALELDAPIIHYRIVGDRIELCTCHGGPFVYSPSLVLSEAQAGGAGVGASPAPAAKKVIRKKK